jgi:hypothetical protein
MTRPFEHTSDPDTVNVNFRMPERERRDLKIWCVENDLTMTDALVAGVTLLRETRALIGPEPVDGLLEVIRSASVFMVDKDSDLRVERRSMVAWAVCEGTYVVNRDGEREHEPMPSSRDEAFIARTRFTLAEALRVARAEAPV